MTIREIAIRIPNAVRSQRLLGKADPIHNAVAATGNKNMQLLADIWHTFIEPHKEPSNCPICLNNILTNFKQMYPTLLELENEYKLLNQL